MGETTLSAVTKMRLLDEMLGTLKVEGQWSVLIMDNLTTQIMTNICGVSDLLDYGVSLVDNVNVPRQPAPDLSAIYFITPTQASVSALLADFSRRGAAPYAAVHIFFSSTVDQALLQSIRSSTKLLDRLRTLKEVNLEFILFPDRRSFTTAQDAALPAFFGASVDSSDDYRTEITAMAARLATVFSTLKEYPAIRFRAALPPGDEYPPGLESRLLVAQRLAVELYERLAELQESGAVPERETCELVITDRGFDPVAPVIHEWTYEAMAHDLLEGTPALRGRVFTFNSEAQSGAKEPKEHVLDERDEMHMELRHRHFAHASLRISAAMDALRSASRLGAGRGGAPKLENLDLRGMSKLVQSLPEYRDQLARVSAHVELASLLNRAVEGRRLTELGKIEQDLVYGDATSKEVIAFLSANQLLPEVDKVRVLMCYSATHQEKLDATRAAQWQKVARLSSADMAAITNLEYLGIPVCKRQRGGLAGLSFGRRRRRALRKDRDQDEDDSQYALTRFVPLLSEILEDAAMGRLSQEEYPYVRPPSSPSAGGSAGGGGGGGPGGGGPGGFKGSNSDLSAGDSDGTPRGTSGVTSFRTIRSGTWAKKASAGGGGAAPSAAPSESAASHRSGGGRAPDPALMRGSRMIAFVIGGFTFSELRVAHRMAARTGRDVLIGGTSVLTPGVFMRQVIGLSGEFQEERQTLEVEAPAAAAAATTSKGLSVRRKKK